MALVRRIDAALHRQGFTIKGVQQLLAQGAAAEPLSSPETLRRIRDALAAALDEDARPD